MKRVAIFPKAIGDAMASLNIIEEHEYNDVSAPLETGWESYPVSRYSIRVYLFMRMPCAYGRELLAKKH